MEREDKERWNDRGKSMSLVCGGGGRRAVLTGDLICFPAKGKGLHHSTPHPKHSRTSSNPCTGHDGCPSSGEINEGACERKPRPQHHNRPIRLLPRGLDHRPEAVSACRSTTDIPHGLRYFPVFLRIFQ
ncbi:hypothetical protein AAFF_G00164940 [Aldrovandia affinis]|uniref:Uncharacterized protein n=1 Tax=Aldrovandia affinis TaxID=143900 RepID=A0AAD7RMM0_9TELE|nr:hypothetical protein AAFF_G00164940 [Aldrovandia affinis]